MRRHKYKVSTPDRRTWDGKTYASRAEMLYAKHLADLKLSGMIMEFIEQPRTWLGVRENVYVPDFLVLPSDPAVAAYFVDVKGVETAAFKKNKRLWKRYAVLNLHVVTVDAAGRPETREVIKPDNT